jgi:hypothetical protein
MTAFTQELQSLINRHSMENGSDTPDFILAQYLNGCLEAYNAALTKREAWYGRAAVGIKGDSPRTAP